MEQYCNKSGGWRKVMHYDVDNVDKLGCLKTMETWRDFKAWVEKKLVDYDAAKGRHESNISELLFRGHADSGWKLESTLERTGMGDMDVVTYYRSVYSADSYLSNFIRGLWEVDVDMKLDYAHMTNFYGMPNLPFVAYLRHHGFPSPLLDWSRSPYVAAYFAFGEMPKESTKVKVWMFQEYAGTPKGTSGPVARIVVQRGVEPSDKRHALQQCVHTICVKCCPPPATMDQVVFCPHVEAFESTSPMRAAGQDKLDYFELPRSERETALRDLIRMNITPYSLFQTDEALIQTAWLTHHYAI